MHFFCFNMVRVTWKVNLTWNDITDGEGPELPTRSNEEFRPFIRRLPEFKFWYSVTKSTVVAMICTLFDCFNIPVFWPILVMYFITLFCITMKRQIKVRNRRCTLFKIFTFNFTYYFILIYDRYANKFYVVILVLYWKS